MNDGSTRTGGAKRPTVLDVAARAGVSRQTVTRAMNDMPGISVATKKRVMTAAKELRYRPSRFGRGLVLGHQLTLGLVIDDLTNPYYPELAASVIATAATRGWSVVIADTAHSPNGVPASLKSLAGQVDAVVGYLRVAPADYDGIFGDLPVVTLETSPVPGHRGVVELDFGPGMRAGVAYLHGRGHRRIALVDIVGPGSISERQRHYRAAMTELGLEPTVYFAEQSVDGGIRAAQAMLVEDPHVDAIIGFNDIVAFGVMKELARAGVHVPRQCAVLGIDGLPIGRISTPELSSLALDLGEVGRLGVELAVQMHSGALPSSGPAVHRSVSHSLLLRESA
ncbi:MULTISPECIES: LacI family DNA-binding transcriptional regulator [unclassified Isoptericola]|uniref:LacI family DNA-binding transcriptional regulator n=1 Tax=Isoptericola sp. NPDC057191 TaxID=3346041 RepID=UPI003629E5CF